MGFQRRTRPIRAVLIAGTRPELIKISPVFEALSSRRHRAILVLSGQHYDGNMSDEFVKELSLPRPAVTMRVGSGSHGEQTGKALIGCERAIETFKPNVVIAQGDTNTTLAAALAASKLKVPFGHVEAGLRSYDREMPEEINRIVVDHISNLLFAPTWKSVLNLCSEGLPRNRIFMTGNTVVDACIRFSQAAEKSRILKRLDLDEDQNLVLVTAHRVANVDSKENLQGIVSSLTQLSECTVVFPVHPRARKRLQQFGLMRKLRKAGHIILTEPLSYLDLLRVLMSSKLALTDSGGIQEEAITLHVPCLTMRLNTERPETIDVGANFLVGTDPDKIVRFTRRIIGDEDFANRMRTALNPFGDGHAGERIVEGLEKAVERKNLTKTCVESPMAPLIGVPLNSGWVG